MTISLSCACPLYDRVWPLYSKQVVPTGISLHFLPLSVEEIFWRQARHAEFDVSECSFSTFTLLRSKGDERFIGIPVFTSRIFRHSSIYVNKNSGIKTPQDLKGKIVGLPEYQITAVVWQRGILQDEYGVSPKDILWRTGGEETPGRTEKVSIDLPAEIRIKSIPRGQTLSKMLDTGEIDALFSARIPSTCKLNGGNVTRLFENYQDVEEAYYKKTAIFPIMHIIVLKRDIYEKHPWIAVNLYRAFCNSKNMTMDEYSDTSALRVSLPGLVHEIERTRALMGDDWWPYGIQKNKKVLETFLRYHHEQGLSKRLMTINDLFAPETMDEEFKI
ncbi:hypothetical protein [Desulfobacula sp.]|uniref:hypothetical protein n=1 Tax=Desulfobacula sp. TaxID=2593537 RepID=UPI00261EC124|nr:hypothetical protein [Desulfobacula sp.]